MLSRFVILSVLVNVSAIGLAHAKPIALYDFVKPTNHPPTTQLVNNQIEKNQQGELLKRLTFSDKVTNPLFTINTDKPWNLSANKSISLHIQNAMDWDITLYVAIKDSDGKVLKATIALPAGPLQRLLIPLKETSSRTWGMRGGITKAWIDDGKRYLLPIEVDGDIDTSKVVSIDLIMEKPNAPQSILVSKVSATDTDAERKAYYHLIDRYGQNNRLTWLEKITSDKALQVAAQTEQKQIQSWLKASPQQNSYGGIGDKPQFKGSGFFTTAKKDGHWYLVTPDGYPFVSLGVNAVVPDASQTYISGRDFMFANLPSKNDPLGHFYGYADTRSGNAAAGGRGVDQGQWYDFYQANLFRVEPNNTLNYWRDLTINRFKAWGFNTLANWSDDKLIDEHKLPYVLPILISGDYASVPSGMDWWGYMPDTFDPKFVQAVDKAVALATKGHTDDPWLLGYFADNELSWGGIGESKMAHYALAMNALKLSLDSPAKQAFIQQLKSKYKTINLLGKAWGIDIASWDVIQAKDFQAPLPNKQYPAIGKDYSQFLKAYADGYFRTVREALTKYDKNHLWLGNRFAAKIPEAITSCAKYCDVISLNIYTLLPKDGYDVDLIARLDKPTMISEFSFGSKDKGSLWAGPVETVSEQARSTAYQNFVTATFDDPHMVGAHWFQYVDEPITGRLLDGENGHLGLVGITNIPFQYFVKTVRKTNFAVSQKILDKALSSHKK